MPSTLPLSQPTATAPAATTPAPSTTATKTTHTLRRSPWTYIHLALHTTAPTAPSAEPDLDALTARQHLTSALRQHLGAHGAATPVDILKIEGRDVWVRVPGEDGAGAVAALGAWVGLSDDEARTAWVVRGWGGWLGPLVMRDGGKGLFEG